VSRLLNNFQLKKYAQLWKYAFILLCVVLNISCSFADLRQIGIKIAPDVTDFILPAADSPIILYFDTEMIKKDVEGIMQISSDLGAVKGDKYWVGNNLYFTPLSGWTAGVRYTLSMTGTMRSADGRDLRMERYVSFYAVNKNDPPALVSFSPLNGSSTGTNDVVFEFNFSRSMDRFSAESAITIDGIGSRSFEWLAEDKILKIIPNKPLSPWIVYRWNLKESAKSIDGVPMLKNYSGYFNTDLDKTLPQVVKIFPVLYADGLWYPTGADIETGLGIGHGIAVEFNKKMSESVLRSIRFEPSLAGRTEMLSENCIVYSFSKTPEPDITYTLIISGDTKDSEGLKTGSDYKINFTPDISVLNIISIKNGEIIYNAGQLINSSLPVYVNPVTGGLNLSIHFSLMFGNEEKKNTPQKITINPFFPKTLSPAALQFVEWTSDDRLLMRWEGLACGNEEIPSYYILTIPGGRGGISPDQEVYMKEDIKIYLSTFVLEYVK